MLCPPGGMNATGIWFLIGNYRESKHGVVSFSPSRLREARDWKYSPESSDQLVQLLGVCPSIPLAVFEIQPPFHRLGRMGSPTCPYLSSWNTKRKVGKRRQTILNLCEDLVFHRMQTKEEDSDQRLTALDLEPWTAEGPERRALLACTTVFRGIF